MLDINKLQVNIEVHNLAIANNVTDEQMAAYIFRNFYSAINHLQKAEKIHRHAVAIANLATQL